MPRCRREKNDQVAKLDAHWQIAINEVLAKNGIHD